MASFTIPPKPRLKQLGLPNIFGQEKKQFFSGQDISPKFDKTQTIIPSSISPLVQGGSGIIITKKEPTPEASLNTNVYGQMTGLPSYAMKDTLLGQGVTGNMAGLFTKSQLQQQQMDKSMEFKRGLRQLGLDPNEFQANEALNELGVDRSMDLLGRLQEYQKNQMEGRFASGLANQGVAGTTQPGVKNTTQPAYSPPQNVRGFAVNPSFNPSFSTRTL
jgi:hypothetical protein